MYSNTQDQMNFNGTHTIAFLESMVGFSLTAMQKIAELQFTFVSTQMDNAIGQLKQIGHFDSASQWYPAAAKLAPGSHARLIVHKAAPLTSAPKATKARINRRKTGKKAR